MEREIQHFSHEHPLFLQAEEQKTDDATEHPDMQMACYGCPAPISGPFYSCKRCVFFLHKVCAELPNEMNYPMHPQHPLTLNLKDTLGDWNFICDMCSESRDRLVYYCNTCDFGVDSICASASHTIKDKCHHHPLTPLQLPICFPCHLCKEEKKGLSYKCHCCPFWVHQNCIVLLTNTIKHSYHVHRLNLLQSVPQEYRRVISNCDICHGLLSSFHCVYYCARCMFFAHVSCARSEATLSSSISRDQNADINPDLSPDGQRIVLLPLQPNSTDLISWFVENSIDPNANIRDKIDHFDHEHPLLLIDEQIDETICEACAVPITNPSYGCSECHYFLHKCCAELPRQILHPSHLEHELSLFPPEGIFFCMYCYQWCNGFYYNCFECKRFRIDIKCASLIRPLYHKAHNHPLVPRLMSSRETCYGCRWTWTHKRLLQCDTCSFKLCLKCAMSPPSIKHRWDKHPFILTYSPPENHYKEYYCILCEDVLNPKHWFYYCSLCDQFAHVSCMLRQSADSNIKYGVSYECEDHEHCLTLIDCTYNNSICNYCRHPLKRGTSVGLECKPCDFNIHLECIESVRD